MIKKLFPYIGEYKLQTLLSPLTIFLEVLLEVFIPILMARIVDVGIPNRDLPYVLKMGGLMVLMAVGALLAGALAARIAAVASNGLARNLSIGLFERVQAFSHKNIDKFSTPSLITRLTNDVTNVQNAFMMCFRMLARSPFMLIMATIMATRISMKLSAIMLLAIPVLGTFMYFISRATYPRFRSMLETYDGMNARTQETLIAIRVVKAFVRGDYETEKFEDSARALKTAQIKAEKLILLTGPMMQLIMYSCIISVLWVGGRDILAGSLQTGELMS
ncbi:MAG: ABC transporter ATP-binding protein, partial [Clostridia bacterium]|nr:ABC transporter ATP-binding protein [Clostridia bacterium]